MAILKEMGMASMILAYNDRFRTAKSGGYVSPTFTEWMLDGIWPDDITPTQAADMVDYYAKLVGVDHVGIASDDMFTTKNVVKFAKANAAAPYE